MIEVQNAIKTFDGNQVLKNVSAIFEAGKTNLIIGQSGSGKTVLMKSIVGIHRIDSGHILYDGRDITIMKRKQLNQLRREIGMLFQGSALFDSMTVLENVRFPLDMFSDETEDEKDRRARFCLERVELSHAVDLYPSEISGGMQKRAAIARAIVLNPKYLFCDEPNSGLDPKTSLLIDKLIQDITHEFNITTIINTHDMNSVMEIGENIIFINKGEKAWQGNSNEIYNTGCQPLEDFIFASELFKKIKHVHSSNK
ncbi:MAG: ATP-binding cassette domain-containing protein [Paludibacteraceae bacterium]|nr:ATP-binding cassette domain-containing protein [Bacteroidales bacterium]MBO5131830.1 ATP-binding cassette domain-containing protein [Paludibacteraceae bacterium]MBQ9100107.1 ATP-binding cassette domain-containing protein [Paludibacteraceae bacterium]MBR6659589.1 ATP-binding cassette domain-containing protein [Paludibacteraceae bacterium]